MNELQKKLQKWGEKGICLAFSGGVDSALLLAEMVDRSRVVAVTFSSQLQTPTDLELARRIAKNYGVKHILLEVDIFKDDQILNNPLNRCYLCKYRLFNSLLELAKSHNLEYVIDGTNADDLHQHRPGRQALQELGVRSPLAELGLDKSWVRKRALEIGLSVANRPASPCLATRLPYGARISLDLLKKISSAEDILKGFELHNVRLRVHDSIARIEVDCSDFDKILAYKEVIVKALKKLDFKYVVLDLEGFRSGSMD